MNSIAGRWWIALAALLALGLALVVTLARPDAARGERGSKARAAESASEPLALPTEPRASAPEPTQATGEPAGERLALSSQERAARPGAFVRLLDRDGRTPLAGHSVSLRFAFASPAESARPPVQGESDAEGLVDLLPGLEGRPQPLEVEVLSDDFRTRFEPPRLAWAELGSTPLRAPDVVLVARPTTRLRGTALDAQSGAPLAQLALRPVSWGDTQAAPELPPSWVRPIDLDAGPWIVTDDEGRFAAAQGYPLGTLWLATPHEELAEVRLDAAGSEVEARFRVGPRLLLEFHPPGGRAASDFVAGLYRAPDEMGLHEELRDPPSPWTPPGWEVEWSNAAAVHAGPPPWTRLSAEELEHPLPSFLILVSRDGAAKGAARIDEFARHAREPLFVDVREFAALAGTVRVEGDGRRVCDLGLYRAGAAEDEPIGYRYLSAPGAFCFQGLERGSYRLELATEGLETQSLEVSVPSAAPIELVVPGLEPDAGERHILEGHLLTESGHALDGPDGARLASVWCREMESGAGVSARVEWDGGTGTFRLGGLRAGRYQLQPMFTRGYFPWQPLPATAEVPGGEVELVVRDGGAHQRLELWIVEPPPDTEVRIEGHSEVPGMHLSRTISADDPLERLPDGRPAQRAEFGPFPAGAVIGLTVGCEGRREALVTSTDFVVTGEVWRAEVSLVPGWQASFSLTDETGESVAGVVLALDGVALAPSGEDGEVRVEFDTKPARLSVVTPGWELVEHHSWSDWGTLFASGEFTLEDGYLDVFLRRTR